MSSVYERSGKIVEDPKVRVECPNWPRAASIHRLQAGYCDAETAAGKQLAIRQKVAPRAS